MATTGPILPEDTASLLVDEVAKPGFFGASLARYGIGLALSATPHSGFHEYRFPDTGEGNVLIDAGSFLGKAYYLGENQELVGAEVRILDASTVEGYGRVRGGWNKGDAYTVFFRAEFEVPSERRGVWRGEQVEPGSEVAWDSGNRVGAFMVFDTRKHPVIRLRLGVSFVSSGRAQLHLRQECPDWDFEAVRKRAEEAWRRELLKIKVVGADEALKRTFYTALYHSLLMPVDKSGENPKWYSKAPYYDDFYAIWDTFRTSSPLLTLLAESRQAQILQSLIDIAEHEGYLPDARSGDCTGNTQGGSHADILFADACAKGVAGVDYGRALSAMIRNAEIPPGGDERKQGRGGLPDYHALGYVSTRYERSGTRTLEFAFDDWAIAQVARSLGDTETGDKFARRAENWKQLWRPLESEGTRGFIMPRKADGTWCDTVPRHRGDGVEEIPFTVLSAGSWEDVFYESHSWEYSFFVPHAVRELIAKVGGAEAFCSRLDTYFDKGYFNVGNEPGFLTPMLYVYAGHPAKTAARVVAIRDGHFNDSRSGIPGNDDSGAMSSLLVFHCLGFFPNAGHDLYLVGSPAFERVELTMENGARLILVARGVSKGRPFVQSATLNGKALTRAWFRHGEIKQGAVIEFEMGSEPSAWGMLEPPP